MDAKKNNYCVVQNFQIRKLLKTERNRHEICAKFNEVEYTLYACYMSILETLKIYRALLCF
jgi:hypothetical protein